MKTYSAKPTDVTRAWHLVDASDLSLGRVASIVAQLLTGKMKPMYTAHIDCGDNVVVVNAEKLRVTGKKLNDKVYFRHTGYPGGIKSKTLQELMDADATKVIEAAVRGMVPANKLRPDRMKRLKVYASEEHQHHAQKPVPYQINKEGKK
jgi:large subunit ribosomal protein L13